MTNPRLAISRNNLLTIKFHQSIALPKGWVWMCWKFQGCRCHILYGSPAPVTLEVHIFVGGGSCLWDWNLLNLLCYFASNFANALFFEMYKTNLEGLRWNQRITLWTDNVSERTQYRDDLRSTQGLDGNSALPGPCKGCQIDDVWDGMSMQLPEVIQNSLKFLLACLNNSHI